jgi:ABC-type Na+ efflux pump permease subunit
MTREKESNTIELILTTPVTSGKIIHGKIWGLVVLVSPLLVLPYATAILFLLFDLVTGRITRPAPAGPVLHWEALISLPVLFVAFAASACMLGLHCSIKCRRTLTAVFWSMAGVITLTGALSGCAAGMSTTSAEVMAFVMPFSPFYGIYAAIDPEKALSGIASAPGANLVETCRIIALFASLFAAALYGVIGYTMHKSMVRGFDMTIRKQTT